MTTKQMQWARAHADAIEAAAYEDNYEGFCTECGELHAMCEPDTRKRECETCGKKAVYGVQELMFRLADDAMVS
jgi:PHP family Zn ribbon phosphoesterase